MKLFPINRQIAVNKIAKRNLKNIKRVQVDPALDRNLTDIVSKNINTLGRIAERNAKEIKFQNAEGLFAEFPEIQVYEKELLGFSKSSYAPIYEKKLIGSYFIPEGCSSKELVQYVNDVSKSVKPKVKPTEERCFIYHRPLG